MERSRSFSVSIVLMPEPDEAGNLHSVARNHDFDVPGCAMSNDRMIVQDSSIFFFVNGGGSAALVEEIAALIGRVNCPGIG
jgi:hypothetical protein